MRILAIAWLDGPESRLNIAAAATTTIPGASTALVLAGVRKNLRTCFLNKHPVRVCILVGR